MSGTLSALAAGDDFITVFEYMICLQERSLATKMHCSTNVRLEQARRGDCCLEECRRVQNTKAFHYRSQAANIPISHALMQRRTKE